MIQDLWGIWGGVGRAREAFGVRGAGCVESVGFSGGTEVGTMLKKILEFLTLRWLWDRR